METVKIEWSLCHCMRSLRPLCQTSTGDCDQALTDNQAFLQDVAAASWEIINLIPSVEDVWSYFKNTLSLIIEEHVPLKRFQTKNHYSPLFSHDLTALIRLKNTLWRRARSSQPPANWLAFRQCRNKTTQVIRKAKISHFKEEFSASSSDAKTFWKSQIHGRNSTNLLLRIYPPLWFLMTLLLLITHGHTFQPTFRKTIEFLWCSCTWLNGCVLLQPVKVFTRPGWTYEVRFKELSWIWWARARVF